MTPAHQSGSVGTLNAGPFLWSDHGSYVEAIDGLGYFLMSLATWFAAPVFAAAVTGLARRRRVRQPRMHARWTFDFGD